MRTAKKKICKIASLILTFVMVLACGAFNSSYASYPADISSASGAGAEALDYEERSNGEALDDGRILIKYTLEEIQEKTVAALENSAHFSPESVEYPFLTQSALEEFYSCYETGTWHLLDSVYPDVAAPDETASPSALRASAQCGASAHLLLNAETGAYQILTINPGGIEFAIYAASEPFSKQFTGTLVNFYEIGEPGLEEEILEEAAQVVEEDEAPSENEEDEASDGLDEDPIASIDEDGKVNEDGSGEEFSGNEGSERNEAEVEDREAETPVVYDGGEEDISKDEEDETEAEAGEGESIAQDSEEAASETANVEAEPQEVAVGEEASEIAEDSSFIELEAEGGSDAVPEAPASEGEPSFIEQAVASVLDLIFPATVYGAEIEDVADEIASESGLKISESALSKTSESEQSNAIILVYSSDPEAAASTVEFFVVDPIKFSMPRSRMLRAAGETAEVAYFPATLYDYMNTSTGFHDIEWGYSPDDIPNVYIKSSRGVVDYSKDFNNFNTPGEEAVKAAQYSYAFENVLWSGYENRDATGTKFRDTSNGFFTYNSKDIRGYFLFNSPLFYNDEDYWPYQSALQNVNFTIDGRWHVYNNGSEESRNLQKFPYQDGVTMGIAENELTSAGDFDIKFLTMDNLRLFPKIDPTLSDTVSIYGVSSATANNNGDQKIAPIGADPGMITAYPNYGMPFLKNGNTYTFDSEENHFFVDENITADATTGLKNLPLLQGKQNERGLFPLDKAATITRIEGTNVDMVDIDGDGNIDYYLGDEVDGGRNFGLDVYNQDVKTIEKLYEIRWDVGGDDDPESSLDWWIYYKQGNEQVRVRASREIAAVEHLNYNFGLNTSINFVMPKDRKVDGKDMEFKFSGDDDLWVYIDGKLALDLGGTHKRANGSINFTTGLVTINEDFTAAQKAKLTGAEYADLRKQGVYVIKETATGTGFPVLGETVDSDSAYSRGPVYWNLYSDVEDSSIEGFLYSDDNEKYTELNDNEGTVGIDPSPYKTHTMQVFYMERSPFESNCMIEFTLPVVESGLSLMKQVEPEDSTAEFNFKAYAADYSTYTVDGELDEVALDAAFDDFEAGTLGDGSIQCLDGSLTGAFTLSHGQTKNFKFNADGFDADESGNLYKYIRFIEDSEGDSSLTFLDGGLIGGQIEGKDTGWLKYAFGETQTIVCTNRLMGEIKVAKSIDKAMVSEGSPTFIFKVEQLDEDGAAMDSWVGCIEFKADKGLSADRTAVDDTPEHIPEPLTFSNLPAGYKYRVTELDSMRYSFTDVFLTDGSASVEDDVGAELEGSSVSFNLTADHLSDLRATYVNTHEGNFKFLTDSDITVNAFNLQS
ncbi:MAG: fibro-slime domain-containing protein [Clostridiales bacterium]|jgi:fibro-slime domain-containing protein|nr:fibro-slime domain-containing protein [Clostridiales bacterium]